MLLGMAAVVTVAIVAVAVAALTLSGVTLAGDPTALAQVTVGPLGGKIEHVQAYGPNGRSVPLAVHGDRLTPLKRLTPGEQVAVDVQVRRPGWIGWALGSKRNEHLTLQAPVAQVTEQWMTVPTGSAVHVRFDGAGQRGRLRDHGPPGPAHAERRAELDLARGTAVDGRRGDRRRGAAVGEARQTHAGQLVSALARTGDGELPRREHEHRPRHPALPDVLEARERSARLLAPTPAAEHAGQLARSQQPHARVHSLRLWSAARLPATRAAPAPSRGDRRRKRTAQHQPDRMDGAARIDAAPAAAACPGGYLPVAVAAPRARMWRTRPARRRRRRSNRRAAASTGAIRTRPTSCRRCGALTRRA